MDKKIAGLVGAVAGLASMSGANAATQNAPNPAEALQASSYGDLLAPIPNAKELLIADDAARADQPARVQLAQVTIQVGHHHHHHHRYHRRVIVIKRHHRHHHHHHHHHHHSNYMAIPRANG